MPDSSDPARPLRVAVVGAWHVHAGDYARRTQEHRDADLVAVWDDDAERGAALAHSYDVDYTEDLAALLAREDLTGVTITTSTVAHRDVMLQAIAAGKHIFTEKLLAPTVSEAEEILTAARTAGVQIVVSLPRLHHGYTTAITEMIDSGALGRLTYARVRLSHDGATAGWLPDRFFDPSVAIGGAVTDLGAHPVYLVQRILGLTPDTVSATYRSVTGRGVEDQAVVSAGYADGAIGVIEAGFVSATGFTIEVFGTKRSLIYSDATGDLLVTDPADGHPGGHAIGVPADAADPYDRWVEAIRTGIRATDNLHRAVELTRLVVVANRAAHEGRTLSYP
ncbi:MAG: Gfo/Idh/MocA family oxidoreductase [Microlunatus sp.]|nr:Gfo/Idh/MocA family oxidoreductase [Microlunatus sp.]MDN5771547.1 Gfo/Idh/MocA family oxidoreductase [Microlunatus sp.]